MAELNQDGALSTKLRSRRRHVNGRRRQPHREGTHRTGHHSRRPPEEDHEQRAEYSRADTRQRP